MSALAELGAATANLDHAKYEYEKEVQRIVARYCPIQLGDILNVPYTRTSKQFVVKGRRISGGYWRVVGPVLKKDGTEGERTTYIEQRIVE